MFITSFIFAKTKNIKEKRKGLEVVLVYKYGTFRIYKLKRPEGKNQPFKAQASEEFFPSSVFLSKQKGTHNLSRGSNTEGSSQNVASYKTLALEKQENQMVVK